MNSAPKQEPATLRTDARHTILSLVGPEYFRPTSSDVVASVPAKYVISPGTEHELARVLEICDRQGVAVIPRGGETKLDWGNPPARAEVILSTSRLTEIIDHAWADLTVSVQAGCSIANLQPALAQHGQRLAIDPLWPSRATIGGMLSTNDSGALRLRFGALRDLIIGVTIALPDGTLASSGGRVVKNVAGYDLPKLVTGAFGTLGVITRAVFRLHPLPQATRTLTCLARDASEAQRLVLAIQDSRLAHSALQVRLIEGTSPQIDILFEATEAGLAAQAEQLKSIVSPAPVVESDPPVWHARQELYSAAKDAPSAAVAKFSILPSQIAATIGILAGAAGHSLRCNAVIQATGLGHVFLEGQPAQIISALRLIREQLEAERGSLFIVKRSSFLSVLDAWGTPANSLPVMQAIKRQLDPKNTLNPGRFLGGI